MALALCIISLLQVSCESSSNKPTDMSDYFPLEKGRFWEYRVETNHTETVPTYTTLRIDNIGKKTISDKDYWVRRTSNGTDYYLRKEQKGIFRYGKRNIISMKPTMDASKRMVLPLPLSENSSTSWSVLTQSYTIHRILPNYEAAHENTAHFQMTYTIESINEEITVPAGNFKQCILIEGQAQIDQLVGANTGDGIVEMTTREWYAPGVGLVKLERLEPLDGGVFKGGKITYELMK